MSPLSWGRLFASVVFVLATPLAATAQLVIDGETISEAQTIDAAKKEGALHHYGTYPVEQMAPIFKAFETDTGIKVDYVRLPGPTLFSRVMTEFTAGKLEADSLDISDQTFVNQFIQRGIFNVPHKVPAFALIPDELEDPQGRWYNILRVISSAIVVNTGRIKEADAPKTLADTLDPKWKGLIGITSIDGLASLSMDLFMLEKLGPDYDAKLAALSPRVYPFIAPLVTDITRGEVGLAVSAISEPVLGQMKVGAPLKLIFPPEGVATFTVASGVSSTAKHPNAAKLFLDWRTSKRGGKIIAMGGAYPINPGAGGPHSDFVTYPPPENVWVIKSADWEKRDARVARWRTLLGTK